MKRAVLCLKQNQSKRGWLKIEYRKSEETEQEDCL